MRLSRLITGGQTGADQGALFGARTHGTPTGGFAPKGYLTEDGPSPWLADFGLVESDDPTYPGRTRQNVRAADACLWFGNPHSPGGKLTLTQCVSANIDSFVVLDRSTPRDVADWLVGYIFTNDPSATPTLMVAGNRESKASGLAAKVEAFVAETLGLLAQEGG